MIRISKYRFIIIISFLIAIILFSIVFAIRIYEINKSYHNEYNLGDKKDLRKFPYPFKAALTICNDIDGTDSAEEFLEIQRFLNTSDSTSMGLGVGLELGNSFFMFNTGNRFSYFSGKNNDKEVISNFVNKGILDCLHSYGDKPDFTREDAIRSIMELNKLKHKINVWIDHGKSISNMDYTKMGGMGDVRESSAYHSDITVKYGFKFFWMARVTSVIGQDRPVKHDMFTGIFDPNYLFSSSINMFKEITKHILAIFGNSKYTMHKDYKLVKISTLRDGQKVFEFLRFDNHWKGIGPGTNSKGLSYILSKQNLKSLIDKHGYMIIYAHFGKNSDCIDVIAKETQEALRNLAKENRNGNIYVTTTSNLLNYYVTRKYLQWKKEIISDTTYIKISGVYDPLTNTDFLPEIELLQGISFYVPEPQKTRIFLGTKEIKNIQMNPTDNSGRKSAMFPLRKFETNFYD